MDAPKAAAACDTVLREVLGGCGGGLHVAALCATLEVQGGTLLDATNPASGHNAFPYLIPLAVDFAGARVGLLAHPDASLATSDPDAPFVLPVVRETARAAGLELLARSPLEYVNAALAEEDASETETTHVADTVQRVAPAGAASEFYYVPGEIARASKKLSLPQFLATRKIIAPRFAEQLANRHLTENDDVDSALVTCEWYLRNLLAASPSSDASAPSARLFSIIPHAFQVALLLDERVNRAEEARDSARLALWNGAWWALRLGGGAAKDGAVVPLPDLAALKVAAGFPANASPADVREALEAENSAARARAASAALDAVVGGASGADAPSVEPGVPDDAARIATLLDMVADEAHAAGRTSDWEWDAARRAVSEEHRARGDEATAALCEYYLQ